MSFNCDHPLMKVLQQRALIAVEVFFKGGEDSLPPFLTHADPGPQIPLKERKRE